MNGDTEEKEKKDTWKKEAIFRGRETGKAFE